MNLLDRKKDSRVMKEVSGDGDWLPVWEDSSGGGER